MTSLLCTYLIMKMITQVILVGHSAGGLSVTAATQKFAKKISLAVYVGATMLQEGLTTPQDLKDVSFSFLLFQLHPN